jgi:uncharacterized protein (DUF433 family)
MIVCKLGFCFILTDYGELDPSDVLGALNYELEGLFAIFLEGV